MPEVPNCDAMASFDQHSSTQNRPTAVFAGDVDLCLGRRDGITASNAIAALAVLRVNLSIAFARFGCLGGAG